MEATTEPSRYRAGPREARRGALLILPGLDGITDGLRALADQFAEEGYEAIAPDLSERLAAAPAEADQGARDLMARLSWGEALVDDIQAAIDPLEGPVFVLGFSFGGTLAWLAAARCSGLAAASAFYGGHIVRFIDEGLRCPVALHFARNDPLVPAADVQRIEESHPHVQAWIYDAQHGFAEPGSTYDAAAARLGLLRTRQLFMRAGGGRSEMGG